MVLEMSYLAATSRVDRLGPREREVLQMIAIGQSDEQVAQQLELSPDVAVKLCADVFDTLGIHPTPYLSRRTLAALTLRHVPRTGR